MANSSFTQQALAYDSIFAVRVRSALIAQAFTVLAEAPFAITAITAATNPVLTTAAHGLATGATVAIKIAGSNCTPSLDGAQTVQVVDGTHLKVLGVTTSGTGTAGTFALTARGVFARQVLNDANRETTRVCPLLVTRTNLMAFTTSYDFMSGHVITAAGDPDIASQIATDWNVLAGV